MLAFPYLPNIIYIYTYIPTYIISYVIYIYISCSTQTGQLLWPRLLVTICSQVYGPVTVARPIGAALYTASGLNVHKWQSTQLHKACLITDAGTLVSACVLRVDMQ